MEDKLVKNKNYIKYIISIIVVWTLLAMSVPATLCSDNMIYAIGELNTYNHSLFNGNLYLADGVVSPRYISDFLFARFMQISDGEWGSIAIFWIWSGVLVYAIAIANIAYRIIRTHQVFFSAMLMCFILFCGNYLAGFTLVALESTSIGMALACAVLSISFLVGEKRNYLVAWILATGAIIFHIHEGIYCCLVIFVFAVIDSIIQKRLLLRENWSLIIAILAMMVIVVPSLLTDSMDISNADFVYIYSAFRHPHHLVPSEWGMDSIYKAVWFDISLFTIHIVASNRSDNKSKKNAYVAVSLVSILIISIVIMYVFTELKPVAFISTLFVSKGFKYVLLIGLIWVTETMIELREKKCYLTSYFCIYYVLEATSYGLRTIGILTALVIIIYNLEKGLVNSNLIESSIISSKVLPITDLLFFSLMIYALREELSLNIESLTKLFSVKSSISSFISCGPEKGLFVIIVFFSISIIGYISKKKYRIGRYLCTLICIAMFFFSLLGKIIVYDSKHDLTILNGRRAVELTMGDELYDLAVQFREKTNFKTDFLADPDDTINTGWFQVASERNCYVIYKVIPSSKKSIDDWYRRYLRVNDFNKRKAREIADIMLMEDIKYVLVDNSRFKEFDEISNYHVFLQSSQDLYRIYNIYNRG